MLPVFIGFQIKQALKAEAEKTALSDAVRKELEEKILRVIQLDSSQKTE